MQTTDFHYFGVFGICIFLIARENLVPLVHRTLVFGPAVIEDDGVRAVLLQDYLAACFAQRLSNSLLDCFLAGHKLSVAAQQNVGAAACHVGGNGHRAHAAGLRHDLGFTLVILGVQHHVFHVLFLEQIGETFGFFNRRSAYQNRALLRVDLLDFVGDGEVFFLLRAVDDVGILEAAHHHIGGDHHNLQLVNLFEFRGFGLGGSGHACQLLVHAEVILEGDGRESLGLAFDLHTFFGFNGLVQTVRPAAAGHHAAGELVDDDHFAVFHHVFHVAPV